jgi:hypothetical protein
LKKLCSRIRYSWQLFSFNFRGVFQPEDEEVLDLPFYFLGSSGLHKANAYSAADQVKNVLVFAKYYTLTEAFVVV